jgi:hypothetical protein
MANMVQQRREDTTPSPPHLRPKQAREADELYADKHKERIRTTASEKDRVACGGDIDVLCSQAWHRCEKAERQQYFIQAQADKARYTTEMAKWVALQNQNFPDDLIQQRLTAEEKTLLHDKAKLEVLKTFLDETRVTKSVVRC